MSMREYPTSGYVVPVSELRKLLPTDGDRALQQELDELLETHPDHDAVSDFLNENLPTDFPSCSAYCPSETDTVDEPMEQDVWYAVFDEEDLYTRTLSKEGEALKKAGIEPVQSHWSVWG